MLCGLKNTQSDPYIENKLSIHCMLLGIVDCVQASEKSNYQGLY